jgi:hypothetical protein
METTIDKARRGNFSCTQESAQFEETLFDVVTYWSMLACRPQTDEQETQIREWEEKLTSPTNKEHVWYWAQGVQILAHKFEGENFPFARLEANFDDSIELWWIDAFVEDAGWFSVKLFHQEDDDRVISVKVEWTTGTGLPENFGEQVEKWLAVPGVTTRTT